MNNAIWLLAALPLWYFSAVTVPFSAGALTVVPALGALSLAIGAVLGVIQRRRRLLLFVLPFAFSEILVAVAGVMRGHVPVTGDAVLNVGLLVFFAAQIAISGYLIYSIKGARASAAALGVFSVSYAAFGVFVAAMSFTDNWR